MSVIKYKSSELSPRTPYQ